MKRLAFGSAGLVIAMMMVNAGNYGLNILLANTLTPSAFGDASLLVTILLLSGVLAATLQLATSIAIIHEPSNRDHQLKTMRRLTNRIGWLGGLLLALVAPVATDVLNVEDSMALLIMAAGFPIHLQLAVERGRLQGELQLGRLAATFLFEGLARVVLTIGIVALTPSVGALAVALNLAFVVGYLACRPRIGRWAWLNLASPAGHPPITSVGVAVVAVTLMTNVDVIAAKGVFDPTTAGEFAALALGGRVVFFASWTLQQALLPLVVADHPTVGKRTRQRLFIAGNAAVCSLLVLVAWVWADTWMALAFGDSFADLSSLLGPYAFGTGLVSIAAGVAVIRSTDDDHSPGRLLLAGAFVMTTVLLVRGESLQAFIDSRLIALVIISTAVVLSGEVLHRPSKRQVAQCRSIEEGVLS